MARVIGPDCVVICNLINTHTDTHIRPGLSATKPINDAPIYFFISKFTFLKVTACRNKGDCTKVHDDGGFELVKPAHEQASTRPKL